MPADKPPLSLKLTFKSATLEDFIARYAVDVSRGGIFIRVMDPLQLRTRVFFVFHLADGSELLSGTGTVVWIRLVSKKRPKVVPGFGLRFDELSPRSKEIHRWILEAKKALETRQPIEGSTPTPAPCFT